MTFPKTKYLSSNKLTIDFSDIVTFKVSYDISEIDQNVSIYSRTPL